MPYARNELQVSPSVSVLLALALFGPACEDDGKTSAPDGAADAAAADAATDAAVCPATGMGTLTLTVTAPVALTPTVAAVGDGAPVALTAGTPVMVPAGPYRIEARRAKVAPVAPALIGTAYQPTSIAFDGCVRNGMTSTVTVTYTLEPGSGKLWTRPANGAAQIAAYAEAQLRAGAEQTPMVTRQMGLTAVADLAFDRHGNLWAIDNVAGNTALVGYRMETLGMPDRPADVRLTGLEGLRALAFDAQGTLWAAQRVAGGMDRVVAIAASELTFPAASAPTTRAVTAARALTSAELAAPADLAFDLAGNLWVASTDRDALVQFGASQLAAGGAVTPAYKVTARKTMGPILGAYGGPTSVAFDASRNLWSAWDANGVLLRFTPTQQMTAATVDDPLALQPMGSGPAGVSASPHALDWEGGLWLSRTNLGGPAALVRVPPAGLAAGGAQATSPVMPSPGLGNGAEVLVVNPAPTGLPVHDG